MASSTGYNGPTTPVVSFFSKEQRARLEALTFARALTNNNELGRRPTLEEWFQISDYIILGEAQ